MQLGEIDYRLGGLDRLNEAGVLLRTEAFAGAVYLAGRAVEGMLRAIIWRSDPEYGVGKKTLDTGHSLREMLSLVEDLGVLKDYEHHSELSTGIQRIGRIWFNNMRFIGAKRLKSYWWNLGEINRNRTMKIAAAEYYNVCSMVVKRCEAICRK